VNDLNVKVESLDGNVLIIREGQALPLLPPNKISLVGDINTVGNFLAVRNTSAAGGTGKQDVDFQKAVILVNAKAMSITLHLDPEDPLGATVTGKLEMSDELQTFGVNTTKLWKLEEFKKLLKHSRIWFADKDQHAKVFEGFSKFIAKKVTDIELNKDDRGNSKNNKTITTDATGVAENFTLALPIFKGQPKRTFTVEVCFQITDAGGVDIWLDSVELREYIIIESERIFSEQLDLCKGFVIINQ